MYIVLFLWAPRSRYVDQQISLLERLMRILSAIHVFSLRKPNYYAHNAYSRVFLNTDDCHLIRFVHDYTGPAVYWLPEFLAQSKFQNPQDYSKSAFQLAHRTDLGLWEFLKAVPHGTEVASHAMRSRIFAWQFQYSPYQFGEELGGAGMEEIVLVDVGGGRGQALEMVKTQHPTLTGRMVLQDLSGVIEEVTKAGLPAFIEPVAGSFFEPQPIKGRSSPSSFVFILDLLVIGVALARNCIDVTLLRLMTFPQIHEHLCSYHK